MSKPSRIGYNFSGELEDYKALLRKFKLDALLKRIGNQSAILSRTPPFEAVRINYTLIHSVSKVQINQEALVSAWNLLDLAYNAILFSNDYRGKEIETNDEMFLLISATEATREKRESGYIKSMIDNDLTNDFWQFFWGFAGEQFKVQQEQIAFDNVARELYILFESSKLLNSPPDFAEIIKQEIGVKWETVLTNVLLIWAISLQNPVLHTRKNPNNRINNEDFLRVLYRYSATYEDIRKSDLGRQIFYTKPYVVTQHEDVISINCVWNLFLYEHCLFWLIRDFYKNQGSRKFTSDFGQCFEIYFRELLDKYLYPGSYCKIPVRKVAQADWRIEVGGYRFLIEQKSALLPLMAKQQSPDIEKIKKFSKQNLLKALQQLESTEQFLQDGKYIKIVLLYESYLHPAFLDVVFSDEACNVTNDFYYWLVTIEEMERLLYTFNTDPRLFSKIVTEKIKRDLEKARGRNLGFVLNLYGVKVNQHLRDGKFYYYRKLAEDGVRQLLTMNTPEST